MTVAKMKTTHSAGAERPFPRVAPATARDGVDGIVPETILTPRDPAEIPELLREARRVGHAVVARGGGTRLDLGNPPTRLERLISLAGLDSAIAHDPDDMVVTAGAGTALATLERVLAARGQRCGLGAWYPDEATIGGIVAANEHGSRAYAYGGPRDQVLGLGVVDGCGRTLRCGGRVVKNVAGYDLPRLFTGSLGTLGIITQVTLRTHPLPEVSEELEIRNADPAALAAACSKLFLSRVPLSSFGVAGQVETAGISWRVRLRIEGTAAQVRSMRTSIAKLGGAEPVPTPGTFEASAPNREENLVLRASSRPDTAVAVAVRWLASIASIVSSARVTVDYPGASVRLIGNVAAFDVANRVIDVTARDLTDVLASLVIERVPLGAKAGRDVWGHRPAELAIMRRVKARFDPDQLLAPGRFVGGI
jgi:glycolate oxidase FAD binding subunit